MRDDAWTLGVNADGSAFLQYGAGPGAPVDFPKFATAVARQQTERRIEKATSAESLSLLLAAGADVNSRDIDGNSAMDIAAAHGYFDAIRILVAARPTAK